MIQLNGKVRKKASAKTDGTNSGATATISGETGIKFAALLITGWSDAASLVTLKDDTTALCEWKVEADKPFVLPIGGLLEGTAGNDMSVELATSTADCSITLIVGKF